MTGEERFGEARLRLHHGEQAERHALHWRNERFDEACLEHREGVIDGFTKRYGCRLLVWFEAHDRIENAIAREKQMKEWRRAWKIRRVGEANPDRTDLYPTLA